MSKLRFTFYLIVFFLLPWVSACSDSAGKEKKNLIRFENVTEDAGLNYSLTPEASFDRDKEAGGIAVADLNDDGYQDVFIAHGTNGSAKLFMNRGDGTFKDSTVESEIVTSSKARGGLFIDMDYDGRLDLLVVEGPPENLLEYRNQGDGTFADVTGDSGISLEGSTFSIAAGDFDRDDDLDLAIAQYGVRPVADEFEGWLWENDGGSFVDVTNELQIPTQSFREQPESANFYQWNFTPTFSDLNQDGFLDLLWAANYVNSNVYLNTNGTPSGMNAVGGFTDEAGMGSAVGDYDNDGDFDWYISSIWHPDKTYDSWSTGNSGNRFYENDGSGVFRDRTDKANVREGFFGWGACFADFDNDGDLDLFQTNGFGDVDTEFGQRYLYFTEDPSVLYENNGDKTFTERADESGLEHSGQGRGISCFDYNLDGKIDILIANNGASPTLFKNTSITGNNFISVELRGRPENLFGIGARIEIETGNKRQVREIQMGSNYLSNNPYSAHFGIGSKNTVDSITVYWNDSIASKSVITNVKANKIFTIKHPDF